MNFVLMLVFVLSSVLGPFRVIRGDDEKKIFCYYNSFAQSRPSVGKFLPEDIDPELCTHIIFAFVKIVRGRGLKPANLNDLTVNDRKGLYDRTLALKRRKPRLKVLLAVGGWAAGSAPFVPMISSARRRKRFVRNVIRYLRRFGFDGLDMDWEFPATRGSPSEDKYRFTYLLQELQAGFQQESRRTGKDKLLLTLAAAGGTYFISRSYEPEKIIHYVDYLLLMAYNYHGSWNNRTGHHSGLYPRLDERGSEREFNQDWTVRFWQSQGAHNNKLILGIATYGMSFTLRSPRRNRPGAPAVGGGRRGKYTREKGILSFYEICEYLDNGWTSVWSKTQQVPYAYHGDQWVGFDNPNSVRLKAEYIMDKNLSGAFIWSVEMDDFRGTCGGGDYPLLSAINKVLRHKQNDVSINRTGKRYRPIDESKEPQRGNTDTRRKGVALKAVNSGVSIAHFGVPDTTTQITVTSKEHLRQKFPPDSDISSESAIYRFPEMDMSSQNGSGSNSQSPGLNHFTEKNAVKSRSGVFSKEKVGRENIYFGNNLNLNVKSVRKKAKPRKTSRKPTQTVPSENISIHPQEVVPKRNEEHLSSYSNKKGENVNIVSHQESTYRANNVNDYSKHSNNQYSGTRNEANSNHGGRSERPNIFLPGNERSKDVLNVKQNRDGIYVQQDNVDAEYDLVNPQVSYSYETANKMSPVQRSRVQESGKYHNEVADKRGIKKPVKNEHQVSPRFSCPSPGIHWDFRSCDSYFVCVLAGRQWKVFHMQCPSGLGFNYRKKVCTVNKPCYKK